MIECDRCGRLFDRKRLKRVIVDGDNANLMPDDYYNQFMEWDVCPSCFAEFLMYIKNAPAKAATLVSAV